MTLRTFGGFSFMGTFILFVLFLIAHGLVLEWLASARHK